MRSMISIVVIAVLLTGCINISTRFQPDDLTVKEELQGSDCVPIIFSMGFGTADLESAKRNGRKLNDDYNDVRYPITRIRRVELSEMMFLFFGEKCVDVIGEREAAINPPGGRS